MSDFNTISPAHLMRRIGLPDAALIIDRRISGDMAAAPFAIPASIIWAPTDTDGLIAVSVGLRRIYKDDIAQLNAGMVIYDALYRWTRDGFDEDHDWPVTVSK